MFGYEAVQILMGLERGGSNRAISSRAAGDLLAAFFYFLPSAILLVK